MLQRVADLSDAEREEIRQLSLAVYPPDQSVHWHGRELKWAAPELCVRIRDQEGTLVSYIGVYLRHATWDGRQVRIGGIGNVKTHPDGRGRGFATLGLRRASEFFAVQPEVDFALLVCEPPLLGFYSRLGWQEFNGQLLIDQNGKASEFTLGRVMTCDVHSNASTSGVIDLCGPPW